MSFGIFLGRPKVKFCKKAAISLLKSCANRGREGRAGPMAAMRAMRHHITCNKSP